MKDLNIAAKTILSNPVNAKKHKVFSIDQYRGSGKKKKACEHEKVLETPAIIPNVHLQCSSVRQGL